MITNTIGLNLNDLLADLGLNFIKFGPTTIKPFEEYFLFYTTPIFNMTEFKPQHFDHLNTYIEQSFNLTDKVFTISEKSIIEYLEPASLAMPEA